jgi:positive regulator of sigma E activity
MTDKEKVHVFIGLSELIIIIAGLSLILFSKNDIARATCIVGMLFGFIIDAYFDKKINKE